MLAFLSIAVALALLAMTVYGLHRFQAMEVEFSVDRSAPLPPLQDNYQTALKEINAGQHPARLELPAAGDSSHGGLQPAAQAEAGSWQQTVTALKEGGQLEAALAVCAAEFPLWTAYNQACIILRMQLAESDPASQPQMEALLHRLYRTAATAEMLHEKGPGSRYLNLRQLKQLPLAAVADLEFDYARLGYAQLRLIRKSDIKLMLQLWGKPVQHDFPRSLYPTWWAEFTRHLA